MVLAIPELIANRIIKRLNFLYGEESATKIYQELKKPLIEFKTNYKNYKARRKFSEKDVILITYGDIIQNDEYKPLKILLDLLDSKLKDIINIIHILPFFPYSSDDGFSVIDYMTVDPTLGNWDDIHKLNTNYDLMFDAVINHISRESQWFKEYLKGNPDFSNFFIEIDEVFDISRVIRPRSLPLLTKFKTNMGLKFIWTTFSEDQIDLNFKNATLLTEIIKILLFYIKHGANLIRLDAIAFLWKETGTSCVHLKQVHEIVKLFRDILDYVAPQTVLITETNVPHDENILYFGDGSDEAQMVYQFSLPPLILYSFVTENSKILTNWAINLNYRDNSTTFLNFTASHDGIGLRPLTGLVSENQINYLCDQMRQRGGYISYRNQTDGTQSPYELNISYFDAINDPSKFSEEEDLQIKRFIASQAIILSLKGVPGIYFHSLFGTRNYYEGVKNTGKFRSINRRKYSKAELDEGLSNDNSHLFKVYTAIRKILKLRINQPAFSPSADQKILFFSEFLFAFLRVTIDESQSILAIHNVSNKNLVIELEIEKTGLKINNKLIDLISNQEYSIINNRISLNIGPYDIFWLSNK